MTAVLAGVILYFIKAIFRNTVYTFTKKSIICKRNFPFKSETKIPYSTIKNISIKQTWSPKSFGTGSRDRYSPLLTKVIIIASTV